MRARLALATGFLIDNPVYLMDEPLVGIDPKTARDLRMLLKNKREGRTILLATHQLADAEQLCDRLLIMDHGRIIEEGKPSDLIKKHAGHEVLEVAYSEDVMQYLRQTFDDARLEAVGDKIHVFTNKSRGVFAKMLGEVPFKETVIRDADLEDVFLKLTGRRLRE